MQTKPPTAALLVIGNEILSGKVQDVNTHYLASELFGLGWELQEVADRRHSQAPPFPV